MRKQVDDKIQKLWDLLSEHRTQMQSVLNELQKQIKNKDPHRVGVLVGLIESLARSDVAYVLMIEMLEELSKPQGGIAG